MNVGNILHNIVSPTEHYYVHVGTHIQILCEEVGTRHSMSSKDEVLSDDMEDQRCWRIAMSYFYSCNEHTHTHTHTHIYIYIYITSSLCIP
jgi:hypothetical protein